MIVTLIERISTDSSGNQANSGSYNPIFSPDGTKVAFYSYASNLIPDDTNGQPDLFVKDLTTDVIIRISTDSGGNQANSGSYNPIFSPDGTKVLFTSSASNLVPGDTNGTSDIFVKDLVTGATTRISTDSTGNQANNSNSNPIFSPDGTKVLFTSSASNLVPGDTNGTSDIFVKDLVTGAVTRINTGIFGEQSNGTASSPVFSSDGTKVVFLSNASNLVPEDTNGVQDIFLKDIASGVVNRISTNSSGNQLGSPSYHPSFSPDGTKMVFRHGYEIFIKDFITGTLTQISTHTDDRWSVYYGNDPVFSPDGETVAVERHFSDREGSSSGEELFVVNVTTGESFVFLWHQDENAFSNFSFSPDGTKIVAVSGVGGGAENILIFDLVTGETFPLTDVNSGSDGGLNPFSSPVFSPDGMKVLFSSDISSLVPGDTNGESDVFVIDLSEPQTIYGTPGNDVLIGGAGIDILIGDSGDDYLDGKGGNDTLYGGDGADSIVGNDGADYLSGGEGNDVLSGGNGEDSILGEGNDDYISGGAGNDVLSGGDGSDSLLGDDGDDYLSGGDGNDVLSGGDGIDSLLGEDGDDYLSGGIGNDILSGGAGTDSLTGDEGDDYLSGGIGNDILSGGNGSDSLVGDNGDDYLSGGDGDDVLSGGVGIDSLSGDNGDDYLSGGIGNDILSGGEGNDTLAGDNDDDYLTGGAGNDLLLGGTGNDVLVGDAGIDYLIGGGGDDILLGGLDLDVLYGSGGSDWFVFQNATAFTGVDRITDFSLAENDVLHLADLLYDFDPLSDAITDFVKTTEASGSSTIAVDVDGAGGAYDFREVTILMGVTGLNVDNLYDTGKIAIA